MRLIDADVLMETLQRLADEAKRNSEYLKMQGLYYAKDEVREAPTVEAIPIEWLKQKYAENDPDGGNEEFDRYLWDSICYVLTAWKEEGIVNDALN